MSDTDADSRSLVVRAADWSSPEFAAYIDPAARLIHEADPEFYGMFSEDEGCVLEAIRAQLAEPRCELGSARVLLAGPALAGIHCCYALGQAVLRQLVSLKALLGVERPREDVTERVRRFKQQVPPLEGPSLYLARLAVAGPFRGRGLGRKLLADFEAEARAAGCDRASVHVRRANTRAVGLYRSAGYDVTGPADLEYLAMVKDLAPEERR